MTLALALGISSTALASVSNYQVKYGDSLYLIGQRYGVSLQDLQEINSIRSDYLEVGQVLKVPTNTTSLPEPKPTIQTYTVRPGDSLFLIAQRNGVSLLALRQANNLWTDNLAVGQRLTIPSTDGSTRPVPSPGSNSQIYTVRSGDTLFLIAQRNNISIADLRQANDLWIDYLEVGQRLVIPKPESKPALSTGKLLNLTESEYDLLARLVTAEAGGEPYEGQVAVAATVIRRVMDSRYPSTVRDVIYQVWDGHYQYEPVLNGYIDRPATPSAYRAVDEALSGNDPSKGANGFFNPKTAVGSWVRSQPVTAEIGNHVFFRS